MKMILANICLAALCVSMVSSACEMDRDFLAEELDKEQFQGKWYMTSWYYHGTGKAPMLENAQTIYSLRKDGNWNITYGVGILEGMCYKNPVEAMADKNSDRQMWVFNFHLHQIMDTDYDNFAVLHQCLDGMEYCTMASTQLVVLSRTPKPNDASQNAINQAVESACIDLKDMSEVEQLKNCLCDDDVKFGLTKSCNFE